MTMKSTPPLLTIRFAVKRDGTPVLSLTRRDGTVAWQRQSRFFPLHDLTHYAVETTLGLREAFYGMMADGWDFADFGTPWPRGPMPNLAEAGLAEAIVGWFDRVYAQGEDEGVAELNRDLAAYFAQHGNPVPRVIEAREFDRIKAMREDLAERWRALRPSESLELVFEVGEVPRVT
jgi:hypothetical protein